MLKWHDLNLTKIANTDGNTATDNSGNPYFRAGNIPISNGSYVWTQDSRMLGHVRNNVGGYVPTVGGIPYVEEGRGILKYSSLAGKCHNNMFLNGSIMANRCVLAANKKAQWIVIGGAMQYGSSIRDVHAINLNREKTIHYDLPDAPIQTLLDVNVSKEGDLLIGFYIYDKGNASMLFYRNDSLYKKVEAEGNGWAIAHIWSNGEVDLVYNASKYTYKSTKTKNITLYGKGRYRLCTNLPESYDKEFNTLQEALDSLKEIGWTFYQEISKYTSEKIVYPDLYHYYYESEYGNVSAVNDEDGLRVNKYSVDSTSDEIGPRKYPWAKTVFTFHNRIGEPYMWIYTDVEKKYPDPIYSETYKESYRFGVGEADDGSRLYADVSASASDIFYTFGNGTYNGIKYNINNERLIATKIRGVDYVLAPDKLYRNNNIIDNRIRSYNTASLCYFPSLTIFNKLAGKK